MPVVAIVDDHQLLAETLQAALITRDVNAVVVAPRSAADLLAELLSLKPDLVLLDLDLGPAGNGVAFVAPLVATGSRVLVVTGSSDRMRIALAMEGGALGYQLKSAGFDGLVARTVAALTTTGSMDPAERSALLSELSTYRAEREHTFAPFRRLTTREQATLRALAQGLAVREIAQQWVVSEATVRSHVRGVLDKLEAPSQLAAVAAAHRSGWLDTLPGGAT
ncbi:MAG: response regulator transcription factor [Jatrophihabitantaceae bacterium]